MSIFSKIKKETAFWFGSLLIAILALIIFLIVPLDNRAKFSSQVKSIYYVDNISVAHQMLIDKFNNQYRDKIEVVAVDLPFSKFSTNERKEILARSLRSKSGRIDVFSIDIIWGPRFARWSYPLDAYFDANELKAFNAQALKTCYYVNQLIAIPHYIDVGLLYYRKDLIEQFPNSTELQDKLQQSMSWMEFIELGKRWDSDNPFYIFAGTSFEGLVCSFHEMLSSAEIERIFSPGKMNLDTPQARRGLGLLVDMINTLRFTPAIITGYDEFKCYRYALENDALFLRGWSGLHQQYRDFFEDRHKLNQMGVAPLPHFDDEQRSSVFGGWNLMVSKFSKNKTEAVTFIKFLLTEENQKLLYENGGYIPVQTALYQNNTFLESNPEFEQYLHLLSYGKHRPLREDYTMISDIMSHYLHAALRQEIGVSEALQQATEMINAQHVFIK